jgi:hypothetical protein
MAPVASDVPAGNLNLFASSIAFDSSAAGQTLPETTEFADPVPMDESWFFSQDFYFDDSIIQWQ